MPVICRHVITNYHRIPHIWQKSAYHMFLQIIAFSQLHGQRLCRTCENLHICHILHICRILRQILLIFPHILHQNSPHILTKISAINRHPQETDKRTLLKTMPPLLCRCTVIRCTITLLPCPCTAAVALFSVMCVYLFLLSG